MYLLIKRSFIHHMSIILKTQKQHKEKFGLKFHQNNHMTRLPGFFISPS